MKIKIDQDIESVIDTANLSAKAFNYSDNYLEADSDNTVYSSKTLHSLPTRDEKVRQVSNTVSNIDAK